MSVDGVSVYEGRARLLMYEDGARLTIWLYCLVQVGHACVVRKELIDLFLPHILARFGIHLQNFVLIIANRENSFVK